MGKRIWDLEDPAATLRQIHRLCAFRQGRSVVAAVRLGDQAVSGVRVASDGGEGLPALPDDSALAGRREFDWLRAWRYSNHMLGALHGDVYVVTPHGWTGTIDQRAGVDPCLRRDSTDRLTVVR